MSEVQRWLGGELEKGEVEKAKRLEGISREMRRWHCLLISNRWTYFISEKERAFENAPPSEKG